MADTTQEELQEYKQHLTSLAGRIKQYSAVHGDHSLAHVRQDVVLTSAIDGLLARLDVTPAEIVTLSEIVSITTTFNEVSKAAELFLDRHQIAAVG
jgi:Asp-tRNA(Asn)/Glu-tRNA(Gln) amidotransferase C subunit